MEGTKGFFSRHLNGLVFAFLLILSLVALSTQSLTVSASSRQIGYSVFSSVQHGFAHIGLFFKDLFHSIGELRQLREEYESLQYKLDDYLSMERELVDLKYENRQLRDQLDFSRKIDYEHLTARIIARESGPLFKGFTINRGSDHGIVSDTSVIARVDGMQSLVGKVTEVSARTARVLPIIDSSCYVAVRLRDSRFEGLMNGMGSENRSLEMKYVKKQAGSEIRYGDLIITSGLRSLYPKGIYVGRITEIQAPEWESSLTLVVKPLVDFSRLEYVIVVLEEFK